jgi:hypothetical protein
LKPIRLSEIRRIAQAQTLADLAEAQEHINQLDEEARANYIRRHSGKWGAVKENLWHLGNLKCWYSEKRVELGLAEVEHFRPKLRVTGVQHAGYWWCVFKWENYRLSHPLVNKRITDYQTGEVVGKGCYFPLQEGCHRAETENEQVNEVPVLIDPTIASDCELIEFDSSSGAAIPKYTEEENSWLFQRADESIDFYYLNEGTWVADREDIMKAVASICDRLIEMRTSGEYEQQEYNDAIDKLDEYLSAYADFTSAAEQVVKEKGINV